MLRRTLSFILVGFLLLAAAAITYGTLFDPEFATNATKAIGSDHEQYDDLDEHADHVHFGGKDEDD